MVKAQDVKDFEKRMYETYPLLYHNHNKDMTETCMCWGFDIDSGWYGIVEELSSKLESLIQKYKEENPNVEFFPRAEQVKEKFGGLRFYMTFETKEMTKLIDEAEEKSYITCEVCGALGKRRSGGWIRTLCDECENDRKTIK